MISLKKSLQTSEWVLSASLVILLISFLAVTKFHEHRKYSQCKVPAAKLENTLDVSIVGEVSKPGVYRALLGSRLGDLVKKSKPKRFADLQMIDLDSPVEKSLNIEIAQLKELSVRIEGAVLEPIELKVAPGSRVCDLKSKIQCSENADLKYFKRRRLLKNGELILVPAKETRSTQSE